jgi:hypothetical protein
MPLYPWRAFENSPSSLRIRNVPKKIGSWNITTVEVQVEYPDNEIIKKDAKLVGGVWICTFEGSTRAGISKNGYSIIVSGVDENNEDVYDYVLGKGDVEILNAEAIVSSDINVSTLKIYESKPADVKNGDAWLEGTTLVLFYDNQELRYGECFKPTAEQLNAINSGINSNKVDNYDRAYAKVPAQTFEANNELADKAFVNSSVQTATANFRGNWATFADVPSNVNEYPEDYAGSKTPTTNDYLVVENVMSDKKTEIRITDDDTLVAYVKSYDENTMTMTVEWLDGSTKTKVAEDYGPDGYELYFSNETYGIMMSKSPDSGNEFTSWRITEIEDFDSGDLFDGKFILGDANSSIGTWRYKYVGNWEIDNKNGWQLEYQVNETPMTANQLAALNSGVTKEKLNTFITPESLDSKLEDLTPKLDYEQIYTYD